jgi:MarR family transcriptional regulator, transcriptional regulator for hemolysin
MSAVPSLGFLVHDIARLIRADFAVRAGKHGMTQTQLRTIAYLGRMEGCSQTELAAAIEVQPITLGRQVDKLERAHMVERRRDPVDRRTVRLFLTARSRQRVASLQAISAEITARATKSMSAQERQSLLRLLGQVRSSLAAQSVQNRAKLLTEARNG